MVRDIFLYLVLIVLFCLIFMAQLIVNVYAFQRQPPVHKPERSGSGSVSSSDIIFV